VADAEFWRSSLDDHKDAVRLTVDGKKKHAIHWLTCVDVWDKMRQK